LERDCRVATKRGEEEKKATQGKSFRRGRPLGGREKGGPRGRKDLKRGEKSKLTEYKKDAVRRIAYTQKEKRMLPESKNNRGENQGEGGGTIMWERFLI